MVAYVDPGLLANREAQNSGYKSIIWHVSPAPPFTAKQGQYLAFIYAYSRIFRQPPRKPTCSGASKSRHPAWIRWCSPSNAPASSGGTPGVARSIGYFGQPEDLPVLR